MLEICNAYMARGKSLILQDVTLSLEAGKFYAVIGPNGSGKSSLIKSISGHYPLQTGQIRHADLELSNQRLNEWQQRIGYMPQDIHLDVELSAVEVVLLGRLHHLSNRIDDRLLNEALDALQTVGLLHLANRSAATLSGGQRQMVLFAQLLMRDSQVLLLDEPVSALDLKHQVALLDILHDQTNQRNSVTLTVLHDLNLAVQYADELLVIKQGRLFARGKPADILDAQLIEAVYGIRADVSLGNDGLPRIVPLRGGYSARQAQQAPHASATLGV
jgi:iron complex transport system ATP-binding protein